MPAGDHSLDAPDAAPVADPGGAASSATGQAARFAAAVIDNVGQVLLGKRDQITLVVAALLAGGHVLLEDVPGVGKTLLAKSLARSIAGTVGRVQGTADLMPADITGVSVYDRSQEAWQFHAGPIFHNVVLVDEINRATPRAQSALLEAMGEGQVTVDGTARALPVPFFVIATQNPFGDVGTFPLVEGQSDRFTIVVSLGLPGREAEKAILAGSGGPAALEALGPVVSGEALVAAVAETDRTYVADAVADYVLDLVEATRARDDLAHGASPRAARWMLQVAKGYAVTSGRDYVTPDDLKAVAGPVLAHRLGAVSRQRTDVSRRLVAELVESVPAPTP